MEKKEKEKEKKKEKEAGPLKRGFSIQIFESWDQITRIYN